jgi:hypothetical protein
MEYGLRGADMIPTWPGDLKIGAGLIGSGSHNSHSALSKSSVKVARHKIAVFFGEWLWKIQESRIARVLQD